MDKLLHPNVEYLFPVESALLEGGDSPKKDNRKFTEAKERYQALLEQKKANPYFTPCMDRSMGILTEQIIQLQQKASFMPPRREPESIHYFAGRPAAPVGGQQTP